MKLRFSVHSFITVCGTLALAAVLVGVAMLREPLMQGRDAGWETNIIEAAIRDFVAHENAGTELKLLLNRNTAALPAWRNEAPPASVGRETYRDFVNTNRSPAILDETLNVGSEYWLVDDSEHRTLLNDDPSLTMTRSLGFLGPVRISRPGVDAFGTEALVYLDAGQVQFYYRMLHDGTSWSVRRRLRQLQRPTRE